MTHTKSMVNSVKLQRAHTQKERAESRSSYVKEAGGSDENEWSDNFLNDPQPAALVQPQRRSQNT